MIKSKISLIFAILLLVFVGGLLGSETQINIEIQTLYEVPDFDILHENAEFNVEAAENIIKYLDNGISPEIGRVEPEGMFNILKYPIQRPEAKISNHYLQGYQCSEWFLNSKKNNFIPI